MPRTVQLVVDRTLVNKVTPGTRVGVLGIYSTFKVGSRGGGGGIVWYSVWGIVWYSVGYCVVQRGGYCVVQRGGYCGDGGRGGIVWCSMVLLRTGHLLPC